MKRASIEDDVLIDPAGLFILFVSTKLNRRIGGRFWNACMFLLYEEQLEHV
jgi:hypothetical protein